MQKKIFIFIQWLAGLMLILIGINKLFGFFFMGAVSPAMPAFITALSATGYLMELVAFVEILAGVAFLLNRYTALMAVILMPVLTNAFLAHLLLSPGSIGRALVPVLTLFTLIVMYDHREQYTRILQPD